MKKNKKYGLVVFDKTTNLGDDIQSYACIRYLPQIDYYVERERMNEFASDNGEMVNTIVSGWYIHDITALPPSPFINPLFVSIHMTDHLFGTCPEYLSGYLLEYLKKYEPIGCRDYVVSDYLTNNNIENYWSACLTLTIPKFSGVKKENYICAVDLTDEELKKLKSLTKKEIKVMTHTLDAEVNSKLSYPERMKNVENILKIYQGAECVVTTRLHCSLPCLALETPVLLIYNGSNIDVKNRLGAFLPYLSHTSKDEFLSSKSLNKLLSSQTKSDEYKIKQKELVSTVTKFIEKDSVEYSENKEVANFYKEYFPKQKEYIVSILNKKHEYEMYELKKQMSVVPNEMQRSLNRSMLNEYVLSKELEAAINNYQGMLSGRVYRTWSRIRRFLGRRNVSWRRKK